MAIELGSSGGKPGRAQPSMNVTPLVDVVLVLLIIFMVITPLLAKQFWLSLPNKVQKADPPSSDNDLSIVITVDSSGAIRMNREVVARAEFSHRLQRALAGTQQRTIFVDADESAEFGDVVNVMDLARAGGAATIAVLTEPLPAR
jgi:biopolymer transport protein TolR